MPLHVGSEVSSFSSWFRDLLNLHLYRAKPLMEEALESIHVGNTGPFSDVKFDGHLPDDFCSHGWVVVTDQLLGIHSVLQTWVEVGSASLSTFVWDKGLHHAISTFRKQKKSSLRYYISMKNIVFCNRTTNTNQKRGPSNIKVFWNEGNERPL